VSSWHEYQNKGLIPNERIGMEVICFDILTRPSKIDGFLDLAGGTEANC
jgi:hypothetical protein